MICKLSQIKKMTKHIVKSFIQRLSETLRPDKHILHIARYKTRSVQAQIPNIYHI
jgi:hypothetical protein